jgi:hypothetical protein
MRLKDDFKSTDNIFAVDASWFNEVAGFINNLEGRDGIIVNKPSKPTESEPPYIGLGS